MEYVLDEGRVAKMPDGCWLWLGATAGPGYAQDGKAYVHRLVMGARPGEQVHHVCRQRLCVRRAHLRVFATQLEHVDAHMGGRCANGHPRVPENLRPRVGPGFDCIPCRREITRRYRARRAAL